MSELTEPYYGKMKELLKHTSDLPPSLLVSATYDGESKVAVLKFYNPESKTIRLWYDNTGHKPYCYSKLPKEELEYLKDRADIVNLEIEEKIDLLNDSKIKVTKIIATDPLAIGGSPSEKSIRNVIEAWEADIKYYENFLYDKNLLVGAYYEIKDSRIVPVDYEIPKVVYESLKRTLDESHPDFKEHILSWAKLLNQPLPSLH
ncbi:MAG: hypothetical protein N3F06_00890, partial [Nitrososphaerales archaeon]|nr:hypothetical protein [Nitrososphaerales archaeon]